MGFLGRVLPGLVFLALSACAAQVPPPLTADQRVAYRVERVAVFLPESASIWWGAGEGSLAAEASVDTGDAESLSAFLDMPQTQAALRDLLTARLSDRLNGELRGTLGGPRPAQLSVLVESVHVSSAAQQILIGGNHVMGGGVQLFDIETGMPLTGPQRMIGLGVGGGGIVGALVDATRDDPLDRTAQSFATFTRQWLTAREPVDVPLTKEANAEPLPPIPAPEPEPAPEAASPPET